MPKLVIYALIGAAAGLLFFAALIAFTIDGLREPYVSVLIIGGAGAVFAFAYFRASRARRTRNGGSSDDVR